MGFLIDAVAHRIVSNGGAMRCIQMCNLAEIISSALMLQVSSMVVAGCRLIQAVSGLTSRPVVDGVDSQA